jgi:CHAT domain-containing protein
MVRIRNDKSKNHFKKGKKMLPVLKWLWQTAVKPIIESIGYTKTEGPTSEIELPRVWWIGVGLLAHFPFHAAGCYEKGQVECAMDIINSTYVPTIKSLLYAKQKDIILPNSPSAKTCFVTMENTPEHDSLEGVEEEAEHIRRILPEGNSTVLHQPTATAVLTEIGQCNNLHLACHGKSDLSDPSKSYLTLVRTNPDERRTRRPDKLFVGDIMRKSTNGSGIAFLRACYSADNPAHGLSDEVIHLASAFQLAGFSHVLGTLWSTRNGSCGEVSEKFYKYLLEGEQEPGHKQVALAFHRAVNDLRLDNLSNPLLWASFVHIGA